MANLRLFEVRKSSEEVVRLRDGLALNKGKLSVGRSYKQGMGRYPINAGRLARQDLVLEEKTRLGCRAARVEIAQSASVELTTRVDCLT